MTHMSARFVDNPYYVEYESLLKRLHKLNADGQGDGEEARILREEMDRPLQELTPEEIERLNNLSSDLYMLQDKEVSLDIYLDRMKVTNATLSAQITRRTLKTASIT